MDTKEETIKNKLNTSKGLECQNCKKMLDGFTGLEKDDEQRPSDGDYAICFYCGSIHTYDSNLTALKLCSSENIDKLKMEHVELWNQLIIMQSRIKSRN